MSNLISNGFHLGEAVDFLARSKLTENQFVESMKSGLIEGKNLSELLADLKFSKNVVTQVALIDFHGNMSGTLTLIENNLRKNLAIRQKLIALSTYPAILLLFLLGIMLGLKNYLLPQLDNGGNFAGFLISHLPMIVLVFALLVSFLVGLIIFIFKRKSALFSWKFWACFPLIKDFVKLYLTAYFAREWGNLIAQGIDLRQVCEIMAGQKSRIFSEMGEKIAQELNYGKNFHEIIRETPIFKPEFALIIEYGEMKDKLGLELSVYADECWEQFFIRLNRAMQLIQPIVFIFVALMIILLYVAMLLPIYESMSDIV